MPWNISENPRTSVIDSKMTCPPRSSTIFLFKDSAVLFSWPSTLTECPRFRHSNASLEPIKPVPPVISMFMVFIGLLFPRLETISIRLEQLGDGSKLHPLKEIGQFSFHFRYAQMMAEASHERRMNDGLIPVKFPGVDVNDSLFPFPR